MTLDMGKESFLYSHSTSALLLGSDDPSIIEESNDLLSQFMRCSSHEDQDSLRKNDRKSLNLSRTRPVTPKDLVSRQSSRRKSPVLPTGEKPSTRSKTRSHVTTERSSVEVSETNSGVRRSGRTRNGPKNYYKIPGFHTTESEEDEPPKSEDTSSPSDPQLPQTSVYPSPCCTADPSDQSSKRKHIKTLSSLLRQRELGHNVISHVQSKVTHDFKPFKAWKGCSNDVIVLAWSPDGTKFAAGATAQCDQHNMAYNRRNNLILGDLTSNSLEELPDHSVPRPGRAAQNQAAGDSRLYMSVTAMQWFGNTLYTGSYDNTVKVWDVSRNKATCSQTLVHDSRVEVMGRSNFQENILATGTNSVGIWMVKENQYIPLKIQRSRFRKDTDLVPTSLAWGVCNATKNFLLAGMSEKEDHGVPQNGQLAAWHVGEASIEPLQFSPNAQNIFDIKWQPNLQTFATASSAGQLTPKDTRSVISLYEPLRLKTRTIAFECPALDINDITFSPSNSDYVTGSCTNGITYVWDKRKSGTILHQLRHGEPINQIDETIPKEQADVGVRVALWGNGIDQFYTGSSDGVLKRWDIRRAPGDVLIHDVAAFQEEIMSGAFSYDKTNLLIGDASGGIHILSSGPFSRDEDNIFKFRSCGGDDESNAESGIKAAQDLLKSGQIVRHPIFGPGQGPRYRGPFAAWARPDGTPPDRLGRTRLKEEWQMQQLLGPDPRHRKGLDENLRKNVASQIQLAQIRNQKRNDNKRKKTKIPDIPRTPKIIRAVAFGDGNFIDLCSDDTDDDDERPGPLRMNKRKSAKAPSGFVTARVEIEVIDLTGDATEAEDTPESPAREEELAEGDGVEIEDIMIEDFWWPASNQIDPNFSDDA